jgi:hypothetical protein
LFSNWENLGEDAAFQLDFATTTSPVPAPQAVVLVGLGAGCVAVRRYVGRRATAYGSFGWGSSFIRTS